ncbi:MAG: hypothetical protein VX475_12850 [Myxococcota bacterium]|nr:hypothetical protein [Myxococcota bacterium]
MIINDTMFFMWITLLKQRLWVQGSVCHYVMQGETDEARATLVEHLAFVRDLNLGPLDEPRFPWWRIYRGLLETGIMLIRFGRDPWALHFYHWPFESNQAPEIQELRYCRDFGFEFQMPTGDEQIAPELMAVVRQQLDESRPELEAFRAAHFASSIETIEAIANAVERHMQENEAGDD